MSALTILQKQFPQVRKVRDARQSIQVRVTKHDSSAARKKDPAACALVRACVREKIADAAVIGISTSYLVKDDVATRYKTSGTVSREITSFDRHQDFAPGKDYVLSRIAPSLRLGCHKGEGGPHKTKRDTSGTVVHRHHTTDIRVIRRQGKRV